MALDDAVFVHPKGLCESEEVGAGTRVWAFASRDGGRAGWQGLQRSGAMRSSSRARWWAIG